MPTEHKWASINCNNLLEFVQGPKHRNDIFVIILLRGCKACFIYSSIDIRLQPWGDCVDFISQMYRVEVNCSERWWE